MKEVSQIFLRLGLLGFGGPIAVMAMMEEEMVRERRWLSQEKFSEMYAVLKMMPGPVATQMVIYLGKTRAGVLGGILAGVLFILPSFLLVLGLSYLYVRGQSIQGSPLFQGLQIGALALILFSTIQLAKPYRTRRDAWVIAIVSTVLVLCFPRWEPLVILGAGVLGSVVVGQWGLGLSKLRTLAFSGILIPVFPLLEVFKSSPLFQLFWVCFKAGAFVFGSGLAIVPLLEADTVRHFHWLTHAEFMDGLAIGQVTPGPVVITVTFIGYKAAGALGAVVATLGIFLPAFVNVLFLVPRLWENFSKTPYARGFSTWAIPAVLGAIAGTTLRLGFLTLNSKLGLGVFALSVLSAIRFSPPAWLLIPATGVAYWVVFNLFSNIWFPN